MTPPSIVLDTTLHDLYSLDDATDPKVVLVYALPTAEVQMTPSIPLSTKFAYQSPLLWADNSDKLAMMYLQVVPQLFGFLAGKMPLVMFDLDQKEDNARQHATPSPLNRPHRADAIRVFDQLCPDQQPELTFVAKPTDIVLSQGAKAAVISPMDCLTHLAHLVHPERQYEVQSKRGLAVSGVPSPASEVIDTDLRPDQVHDERLVDAEVARMMKSICERTPPFVIKVPQSCAGQGTFVVRSEMGKQDAIDVLTGELRRMLRQLNNSNEHLRPSSLVVQEMIPGEAVALSLFVTKSGRPVFIGCCRQLIDIAGHWSGGFISYKDQDRLERQYADIAEKLAKFSHQNGYYGPLSVDVMTDQDGKHLAIDPNARVSGTTPLGLIKNHLSLQRNLQEAAIFFPLFLSCTRDEFERAFDKEHQEGALIITGWCHDRQGKYSVTSIILAAETRDRLSEFINRVYVYKIDE